jgi:hypothetical protein
MFRSIRSKYIARRNQRRELLQKLEVMERNQLDVGTAIATLVTAETEVLKAVNEYRTDLRPSGFAWTQAGIWFVLSAVILVYAAITTVNESSISYNVTTLHQQADADRTIAFEGVVAYLANPARKQNDMPNVFNSALNQLRSANKTDAEADGIENGLSGGQLRTQIALGAGSAFFGAVVGWILTQFLTLLRWPDKWRPRSKRR